MRLFLKISNVQIRDYFYPIKVKFRIGAETFDPKIRTSFNKGIDESVTAKDIAEKLEKEHKIEVDKKKVLLDDAIKTAGITQVEVKLYEGVTTKIKVEISAE